MTKWLDGIGFCARVLGSDRHGSVLLLLSGVAFAVALSVAPVAHAQTGTTVFLGAAKDNTLYESATGSLSNGMGSSFFAGRNGSGQIRRGLLAFDIASAIPAGSTIVDVELTLHMTRTRSGGATTGLHRALADWGEGASNAGGQEGGGVTAMDGDATWLHTFSPLSSWQNPGGDFSPVASASISVGFIGIYTWPGTPSLISDVQLWLDNPATDFGWLIKGEESTSFTAKQFASRNNFDPSLQPELLVTYVPVTTCLGDADGDNMVIFADITSVLGNWLNNYLPGTGPGDANGDGVVDFMDISSVLGNWLAVCP